MPWHIHCYYPVLRELGKKGGAAPPFPPLGEALSSIGELQIRPQDLSCVRCKVMCYFLQEGGEWTETCTN